MEPPNPPPADGSETTADASPSLAKPSSTLVPGGVPPPVDTMPGPDDVTDVPDPDEDDLDDLDDMLNDFSNVQLGPGQPAAHDATSPPPPPPPADLGGKDAAPEPSVARHAKPDLEDDDFSEEDQFAKQLEAGMADLLGELEKSPDMQAQLEDMLKQMGAAASSDAGQASADTPSSGAPPARSGSGGRTDADADASFQETIRRTMERMQTSGDQATAAAASGGADDFMAEMLKQMSSGDFGGADGNDEDFSKMLMGMMEQLTNKDILYEPMKELDDKFPDWIAKNRDATPAEDMKRYEEQRAIVREIVAKFEEAAYADSNSADREFIVDRMAKMQAAGSPPSDLVGDMSSAQEAFNAPDEQCNPQ